jgi:hypothetical protein
VLADLVCTKHNPVDTRPAYPQTPHYLAGAHTLFLQRRNLRRVDTALAARHLPAALALASLRAPKRLKWDFG